MDEAEYYRRLMEAEEEARAKREPPATAPSPRAKALIEKIKGKTGASQEETAQAAVAQEAIKIQAAKQAPTTKPSPKAEALIKEIQVEKPLEKKAAEATARKIVREGYPVITPTPPLYLTASTGKTTQLYLTKEQRDALSRETTKEMRTFGKGFVPYWLTKERWGDMSTVERAVSLAIDTASAVLLIAATARGGNILVAARKVKSLKGTFPENVPGLRVITNAELKQIIRKMPEYKKLTPEQLAKLTVSLDKPIKTPYQPITLVKETPTGAKYLRSTAEVKPSIRAVEGGGTKPVTTPPDLKPPTAKPTPGKVAPPKGGGGATREPSTSTMTVEKMLEQFGYKPARVPSRIVPLVIPRPVPSPKTTPSKRPTPTITPTVAPSPKPSVTAAPTPSPGPSKEPTPTPTPRPSYTTAEEPETKPGPQGDIQPKPSPKPMPMSQKVKVPTPTPEPTPPATPGETTEALRVGKPFKLPTLTGTKAEEKEWTEEDIKSAIAWKVGFAIHALKSPYRRGIDEKSWHISKAPKGLAVFDVSGPGSQQRSVRVTGRFPARLTVDVGNQDVVMTRAGPGRVHMRHFRDTKGTTSMLTIKRHNKPVSRKRGGMYHTNVAGGLILSRKPLRVF